MREPKVRNMGWAYWVGYTLFKSIAKACFNIQVHNRDNLIEDRGCLIVCNHVSFLDPPLVGVAHDGGVYYLARKTLFKGPAKSIFPHWNAVPIDQENPDMASIKNIIKLLKSGERVVMFPEGSRAWDGHLLPAKAGVGLIISKAKVPVLPMRLFGAHEAFPRGAKFWRNKQVDLVIGECIDFSDKELNSKGRDAYQNIADRVMASIGELELP